MVRSKLQKTLRTHVCSVSFGRLGRSGEVNGKVGAQKTLRINVCSASLKLAATKNLVHFSICACHPCAGAMLIFSVSFQF